jgi:hypothetical protein
MREGARPCLGRDRQKNAESTPADYFGATYNYILHDHLVLVIDHPIRSNVSSRPGSNHEVVACTAGPAPVTTNQTRPGIVY